MKFSTFAICLTSLVLAYVALGQNPKVAASEKPMSRAELLAAANIPKPITLPVPVAAISLPEDCEQTNVSITLSQMPQGTLSARRVSHNDGRLYLEIRPSQGPLSGTAEIRSKNKSLGVRHLNGSLWLSLKPRIGRIQISVICPGTNNPLQLSAPTTLIEIRGPRIFLNGEPFLMKGAMSRELNEADANYIHSLGINTLRGLNALDDCERYGFMNVASLNTGKRVTKDMMAVPDAEFPAVIAKCLDWFKETGPARAASPNTLIFQAGNEFTAGGAPPGSSESISLKRRHVSQLLVAERNYLKSLAPMLPVGYANQDLTFLTPDCLDVYMHNSFLPLDRYNYPWDDFMRWQGCLPPDGVDGQGRPFVNSEFGANRYLCQSYHEGPNNPFLEKIHAWNFPCRWKEFMENGTVGGCIYSLYDLATPRDQGCSRFGILTYDRKPKLACWDVAHLWRDFEIKTDGSQLQIQFKRDYWARDCQLTISPVGLQPVTRRLDDFAPKSTRTISLSALGLANNTKGFRWRLDFNTHSGLIAQATGAWPIRLEEDDFLQRLQSRDTFSFLRELFDTEVLTVDAKPAPPALALMKNADGLYPVALRKRNGVTYLLVISREKIADKGALQNGVTLEVAFKGKVNKVDDMTGQPLNEKIEVELTDHGLRLKNIQAARIPGAIGARSDTPFMLPIYRISP